jgi:hypothetical protein
MRKVLIYLFASTPALSVAFFATLIPTSVRAVPSFARQTGLPCSGCHYNPPELNPAGRKFKLLGYVDKDKDKKMITAEPKKRVAPLDLLESLPFSVMFETSLSSTNTPQPTTQNGSFEFPQDVSMFLAGSWGTHVGSLLQVTYNTRDDHFTIDNTDVRYANKRNMNGKELIYGVTLNNNPTIEDVWNSTPAWGFPFIASDAAPTPNVAPIIASGLGQDVAGIGGYAMYDNHFYVDGTIYRSDHVANTNPNPGIGFDHNIRGVAPYWRVAWNESTPTTQFEIGTYGMHMSSTPFAVVGLQDAYTDYAVDFQLDRTVVRKDVFSLRGTYIHENSALTATFQSMGAQQINHHLDTVLANAEYHFGNRLSGTVGWFDTGGTVDPTLYGSATAVTGSANGNPRGAGYILNFSYWPMQNLDLAFQYTGYTRFNGASVNYDGAGRNASGNNTVYLLARFVF